MEGHVKESRPLVVRASTAADSLHLFAAAPLRLVSYPKDNKAPWEESTRSSSGQDQGS